MTATMIPKKSAEESGSDWDSLSDVNAGAAAASTVAAAAPSAASSLRSGGATPPTSRGPIPPFDFRSEAPAAAHPPGGTGRAGRARGPVTTPPQPGTEQPLRAASTAPRQQISPYTLQWPPEHSGALGHSLHRDGPTPTPDDAVATDEGGMLSDGAPLGGGCENQAFEGDGPHLSLPPIPTPRSGRQGNSTNNPSTEHLVLNIGSDSPNDISDPMVLATNEALRRCCDIIGVPFRLLMLLLHHTIRLVLLRVVRPLVVDSIALVIEYLLRPLVLGAVAPAFVSITAGAVMLNSLVLECLQPLYLLISSFRLVEVNIGGRNPAPSFDVELTGSKRPALRHV